MQKEIRIRVTPKVAATDLLLKKEAARELGVDVRCINDIRIVRRSIDARQKNVFINLMLAVALDDTDKVSAPVSLPEYKDIKDSPFKVIIVGAGPAGLFAALRAIESGIRPIVLERGKGVDERRLDVAAISKTGIVDKDSNYCFGEGGAGTFSDGKLFTRSKKRGSVTHVLNALVAHGAQPEILIDAHPHIGSDRLPQIIKNIRNTIINHGGEVHFNTRVEKILIKNGKCEGVVDQNNNEYLGPVLLATGHSARDTYKMLKESGVNMEAKTIAMGVRLEHPQELIDKIQYHNEAGRGQYLPAAEYSFVTQVDNRGVYSFCMCPGGVVVPAASAPNESVVNGMSASARASEWSNAGMVVEIRPGDFKEFEKYGEFEILELQKSLERDFYESSGETLNVPAQRMLDFVKGKISKTLPRSSYPAGIHSAPMHILLPKHISERLQKGFEKFGKSSRGFLTNDAIVLGLESRTSAPVRIPRDNETREHVNIKGLYPCGEGAGYAGGIVSAALDGERSIEELHKRLIE